MDAILEMMKGWDPIGQAIFLLLIIGAVFSGFAGLGAFVLRLKEGPYSAGTDADE